MTETRTADLRVALAVALFGLAVYGCTEASGAPGPEAAVPAAQSVAFVQDAVEAAGLSFESTRQEGDALVLTEARYTLGDGTIVSAETLRLVGAGRVDGGRMSAERIEASGVVMRGADDETVTRIGALTLDGASFDKPQPASDDASIEDTRRVRAAALDSVAFDGLRAEDVSYDGDGSSGTLDRLSVAGYRGGVLGAVRAEGLVADLPGGGDAASRALGGVDPSLAGLIEGPLGRMLTASADRVIVETVTWDGLDASGIRDAFASGQRLGLDTDDIVFGDLIVRGQTSLIEDEVASRTEETRLSDVRFAGMLPTNAVIETVGARADMTAFAGEGDEAAVALLEERGLDDVPSRSAARFAYDPDEGRMTMAGEGTMDGLYASSFSLALGGLAPAVAFVLAPPEEEVDTAETALAKASLLGLTVTLTDEQLVDTAFALAALGSDQSAMTLRQQAVGVVTLGALQGGAISPRVPDYAGAVSAFLSEGGTLTIRMAPDGGLTAADAQAVTTTNPAGILEAADLTITRTP